MSEPMESHNHIIMLMKKIMDRKTDRKWYVFPENAEDFRWQDVPIFMMLGAATLIGAMLFLGSCGFFLFSIFWVLGHMVLFLVKLPIAIIAIICFTIVGAGVTFLIWLFKD